MASNPDQESSGGSIVDAFFKLFSTDKPQAAQTTTATQSTQFDREWRRPSTQSVPGIVKQVRATPSEYPSTLQSKSKESLSSSLPDLPIGFEGESPSNLHKQVSSSSSNSNDDNKIPWKRSSQNLKAVPSSPSPLHGSMSEIPFTIADPKIKKFKTLLSQENIDIESLSKLSWNGIPEEFRAPTWRLLLGYAPPSTNRRDSVITRKRDEYRDLLNRYYANPLTNELKPEWLRSISSQESALIHQIKIDVPRTLPHNPLFSSAPIQKALERILLMWALRHPASGYVQGINDLVTPFIVVFLREMLTGRTYHPPPESGAETSNPSTESSTSCANTNTPGDSPRCDPDALSENSCDSDSDLHQEYSAPITVESPSEPKRFERNKEDLKIDHRMVTAEDIAVVEADAYWALSKFIDCIQDNYTVSQPGIQRALRLLGELISTIEPKLYSHLESLGIMFVQFAFRWMNCLLIRELPLNLVIRLWDTYISEGDRFPGFHTFVCAALLTHFKNELIAGDFQQAMVFLHRLPTDSWTNDTLEPIISQAFMWQALYAGAPGHLKST